MQGARNQLLADAALPGDQYVQIRIAHLAGDLEHLQDGVALAEYLGLGKCHGRSMKHLGLEASSFPSDGELALLFHEKETKTI
mgnify:CR=1 FL=1